MFVHNQYFSPSVATLETSVNVLAPVLDMMYTAIKNENNNYSPLRYPGGKRRLVDFIKSIIDQNDLKEVPILSLFQVVPPLL